ncbi:putative type IX secretion system sortase PorU2 [Tellurirhabdus bombi]|uniref:putative type IX secretion system sortase PorU2 n=1 Tax=Tellurirhabdus bombi TaxID=2907205 RepID=UPI001F1D0EAE|nr:C25 family cysteine peptidase [Tellurirhabdus bombi]
MRYCLLFLFQFVIIFSYAQALRYGNEWIDYNQTYYRIPVTQQGLYRLTTDDLRRAGLPVSTIDPTTLQLFRRGIEQAILVSGESDRKLDEADYLQFIGTGNDGRQDSILYRPSSAQPHARYSLFSDTAAYFLTWRTDGKAGKRMAVINETNQTNLTPESYHLAEKLLLLTDEYSFKDSESLVSSKQVYFEEGEGWSGILRQKGVAADHTLRLDNWLRTAPVKPEMEVLLNGRDNFPHLVDVSVGASGASRRLLGTATFQAFQTPKIKGQLEPTDLSAANDITVSTLSRGSAEFDRYSVSYIQIRYPQHFNLAGISQQTFNLLKNPQARSYLELTNAPENLALFDVTDPTAPRRLTSVRTGTTEKVVVPGTDAARQLWGTATVLKPVKLERIVFRKLDPAKPNYLIISHEQLMKPAGSTPDAVRAYAGYRASSAGGRYDTLVVTFRELVNQFSFGERTSLAIRRFADYMLSSGSATGGRDKFLLLMGRGNMHYPTRKNALQDQLDLVPTVSYPGSDVSLTEGLGGSPNYIPAMPTGRINTLRPQEVIQYLNKVKEFESTPANAAWRKSVLHLSGGRSAYELTAFRTIMDGVKNTATAQFLGAAVTTRSKKTDEPVERIEVSDVVNRGVGLITAFGHSSPIVMDTDIGYASNPTYGYQNKGRYPMMFFNGCGIANIFYGATNSLSTDWLLTPDKGAIAALGHGYSGYVGQLDNFTRVFYETLLADSVYLSQPIGVVHREASRRTLQRFPSDMDIANIQQMLLQGDPALRIFPMPKADFQLTPEGVSRAGDPAAKDSVRLKVEIGNVGRFNSRELASLTVRRLLPGGSYQTLTQLAGRPVANRDTVIIAFRPAAEAGKISYELVVDAEKRVDEMDETNNLLVFSAESTTNGFAVTLPSAGDRFPPDRLNPLLEVTFDGMRIADGAIVSANPLIQVNLLDEDRYRIRQDTVGIDVLLKRPCPSCNFERIYLGGDEVEWRPAGSDNRFTLNYRPRNLSEGVYTLQVQAADVAGNKAGALPYQIRFRVKNEDSLSVAQAAPNPFSTSTRIRFVLSGKESPGDGQVVIHSLTGKMVWRSVQPVRIGENLFEWNGTDQDGAALPAGLYLYQLLLPDGRKQGGRVVLIR